MINPDRLEKLIKLRNDLAVDLERARDPESAHVVLGGHSRPKRTLANEEQAEVRRLEKLLANVDADIDSAVTMNTDAGDCPQSLSMVWGGTRRAFADVIHRLYDHGWLRAKSRSDALRQACQHWTHADGKPLDPKALNSNLQERQAEGKGPVELPFKIPRTPTKH